MVDGETFTVKNFSALFVLDVLRSTVHAISNQRLNRGLRSLL